MRNNFRLGLIVNPIAGMGGSVGLKGTDGPTILALARARGALPRAPARTGVALMRLMVARDAIELFAAPGNMGETVARAAGFDPVVLGDAAIGETTAQQTCRAAEAMVAAGIGLLLFVGGDGTARDVAAATDGRIPVIGIPAGVKMHSAVFATSPQAAAELVLQHLRQPLPLRDMEVMDLDEEAYRQGAVSAALYGYLKVPFDPELVQGVKIGRAAGETAILHAIAAEVLNRLEQGQLCILGPGTTTRAVAVALGLPKTLMGVDLIRDGQMLTADASEFAILQALSNRPACIVVTPIGGQGHFLGRGNQQISAAVLRRVGLGNILVVATDEKLASLHNQALRVDTGDSNLDRRLRGHRRIITGRGTEAICMVTS